MPPSIQCPHCGIDVPLPPDLGPKKTRARRFWGAFIIVYIGCSVALTLAPSILKAHPEQDITLSDVTRRNDDRYYLDFVGLAENHSNHRWEWVKVKAELYDASGEFLDQATTLVEKLDARGSEHFKVHFISYRDDRYQSLLKGSTVKVKVVGGDRPLW